MERVSCVKTESTCSSGLPDALGQSRQSGTGTESVFGIHGGTRGIRRCCRNGRISWIGHMRVHACGGIGGEFQRYRGSRRMAARVGQSLLKDSIGDFAGFPVELAQLLDVNPCVEPHAGGTCVSEKRIQRFTGQRRLIGRRQLRLRLLRMTQHVDDTVRLVQRSCRLFANLLGFVRDSAGLPGQLAGVQTSRFGRELLRLGLQRARIQRQQGKRMGKRVMRFGSDRVGQLLTVDRGLELRHLRVRRVRLGRGQRCQGARTDMQPRQSPRWPAPTMQPLSR